MMDLMDFEAIKQRREDMIREVEQYRLARALKSRRRHVSDRRSVLVWELKRIAGRLRKLLRTSR